MLVESRGELLDLEGAIPVVVLKTPPLRSRDINFLFGAALSGFMRSRGMARRLEKQGAEVARSGSRPERLGRCKDWRGTPRQR